MDIEKTPEGIVAILIDSDGKVLASAADFNASSPAGFSKKEAQKYRAKRSLALEAVQKLASPILSNAIDAYDAEKLVDAMKKNGCRTHIVPIGYSDDEDT